MAEENAVAEEVEKENHPLKSRKFRGIENWHQWLKLWNNPEATIQELIGLLHCGFSVELYGKYDEPEYSTNDRVVFYFSVADGWSDKDLLRKPEDRNIEYDIGRDAHGRRINKTLAGIRQMVALEAFEMLLLHFFKAVSFNKHRGVFDNGWDIIIPSEKIFVSLLHFFRVETGKYSLRESLPNYPLTDDESAHKKNILGEFLVRLATFMWNWSGAERDSWESEKDRAEREQYNQETRARMEAAKPWMIEVLSVIGELDLLRDWLTNLDEPCLETLKKIALSNELSSYRHPVVKDRKVETIEEACFVGSVAGWLLKEREIRLRQQERLSQIYQAHLAKKEADRELERLQVAESNE